MEKLAKEELVIKVEQQNGVVKYIKNPFLALVEKASEIILKFSNVLLLTPAALNKLELLPKVEEEENQIKIMSLHICSFFTSISVVYPISNTYNIV